MTDKIKQILTRHWGHSQFRPLQEDIILSVLNKQDTLALMPTGGGKSICFQVPALAQEGICLVISPLISLMKDQVEHLKKKGIPAVAIISGMSRHEIDLALDNCIYGKEKFLYLSPERLTSDLFIERLYKMNINLIAVDEAHCITQWGHDFRPSYFKIAEVRDHLPGVPILALTATATPEVQIEIQKNLRFINGQVFRKSFERKNLSYVVLHEEDKHRRMLNVLNSVHGSGVIYVRSRKKTREIAEFLQRNKIKASYYHAGLDMKSRNRLQEEWMTGKTSVVVATNAFGMGIDKANVRYVIHLDIPESLEAYYQEAGRAGRDEKSSYAILFYNESDKADLERRVETSFPELKVIRKTYQALANYYQLPVGSGKGVSFDFEIVDFCSNYNLGISETFNCIKILEMQGLIATSDSADFRSRLHFSYKHKDLYEFQVKNPQLDPLIKILLRSYEGVFDDYVFINENEVASRCAVTHEETIRQLELLSRVKVLDYIPSKECPQLTFTTERLDIKDLHIDKHHLSERKERYLKRIRAMWNYASEKKECRSRMLLAYFGEEAHQRCGVCDFCLQRNKIGVSDLEFEQIHTQVLSLLAKEKQSLPVLMKAIGTAKEDVSLKVISWMIDNGKIRYAKGNVLEWVDR